MRFTNMRPELKVFSYNLRRKLCDADMTQGYLAKQTGMHRNMIYRYLYGVSEPGLIAITRLARGLNCAPGELLEGIDNETRG